MEAEAAVDELRVPVDLSAEEDDDASDTLLSSSSSPGTGSSVAMALRLPLKRSLRGEVLERWPGWYSPARKRLKSSPDTSLCHARSGSPRPDSDEALFTWSVLCAQRRANTSNKENLRFWQRASGQEVSPVPSSPLPSSPLPSTPTCAPIPAPYPDGYNPQEEVIRLHLHDPGMSVSAELMSRGAETLGCCRLKPINPDFCQHATSDVLNFPRCTSETLDIPEQESALDRLVPPQEASKAYEEDDLRLLVLSPAEERRRPRTARCLCLRPGICNRRKPLWLRMFDLMPVISYKTILAWMWKLRPPYFIIFMGLVQVSVFSIPKATRHWEMYTHYLVWRNSRMAREPWRLLSYALVHSDWVHLTLNVGVQTIVALTLEQEQGPLRVAGVYVGGVMAGALSTALTSPHINLVGSSAGVYAMLTSHLSHIILNSDGMRYRRTRVAAILMCVLADLVHTVYHALLAGNATPQIGVSAHCSGALSGVLLGLTIYRSTSPGKFASPRVLLVTRISSILLYVMPAVCTAAWVVYRPHVEKSNRGYR